MNLKSFMFFSILMTSTIITVTSNNWIGMWMGMEINLMSLIPLLYEKKNMMSSQSMMIYFLTQSISSIILLCSILTSKFIFYNNFENLPQTMLIISLMIKMASAPFHMWLPEIMTNLSWLNCMILMTWQKIAPMTILSNTINNPTIIIFILMSSIMGALGGINQTSFRKLMAYSSINHLSWMMTLMVMEKFWFMYLMLYSMIMLMMIIMLNKKNIFFVNQVATFNLPILEKITISMLMMSMGGLPPFMGFLLKWMVIQNMINSSMWLLLLTMMMMSLITLFFYIRMMYPLIMIYNTKTTWSNMKFNNKVTLSILTLNLLFPLVLIMPVF
uniref:NADH-ubiquinone oxidoreductase chain 2 n=1 Tax=Dindymus rubiginosus TaxID=1906767 RepID=A0A4Y1JVZ6_9HEMI|nr:NADH dehydrogenase subunit 2 [Dindymus rubiginosus]APO08936.1 NADH dehydrogenase subunit 2 [Dindymus rubiginosus]